MKTRSKSSPSGDDIQIFGYSWSEIEAKQGKRYASPELPRYPTPDYGADPLPDGRFRMVPSGDIVSLEERQRRLTPI